MPTPQNGPTNSNNSSAKPFYGVGTLRVDVAKWSDTLQKSGSKCYEIFKVCLAILTCKVLKG